MKNWYQEFPTRKLGSLDLWTLSLKSPRFFSNEFADSIFATFTPKRADRLTNSYRIFDTFGPN